MVRWPTISPCRHSAGQRSLANNWLAQFLASVLRVPVVRPQTVETTALGAAYLAGLAVGFWKSRNEIAALWSAGRIFRPAASPAAMRRLHAAWQQAVMRSKSRV